MAQYLTERSSPLTLKDVYIFFTTVEIITDLDNKTSGLIEHRLPPFLVVSSKFYRKTRGGQTDPRKILENRAVNIKITKRLLT